MTNCCKVCNKVASSKCSKCFQVFYCSRNCQIADWKAGHKSACKPYEVKKIEILNLSLHMTCWHFAPVFQVMRNDKLGRFMVASRDLKAGEVIFREFAVVHGPKMKSHPICLGCHKTLHGVNTYRCTKCAWPLCGKKCENLDPHAVECQLMSAKNYKCPTAQSKRSQVESDAIYCLIFPLRFLLLKRSQPEL